MTSGVYIRTEKHKQALRGRKMPNKGKKNPNMARVGKKNGMYGTKGWYGWRNISGLGKGFHGKHTEITKLKMSLTKKGKPSKLKGKPRPQYQGENSSNWKGGITNKDNLQRGIFKRYIQKKVFERDNYTCQLCGKRGVKLQVDHIQSWKDYVELRFCIDNCRTLCMDCHYFITFGKTKPKEVKTWGHNFKFRQKGEY